jgi:hypothetical protein
MEDQTDFSGEAFNCEGVADGSRTPSLRYPRFVSPWPRGAMGAHLKSPSMPHDWRTDFEHKAPGNLDSIWHEAHFLPWRGMVSCFSIIIVTVQAHSCIVMAVLISRQIQIALHVVMTAAEPIAWIHPTFRSK